MNTIAKRISLALVSNALAEKALRIGVKAYINNCLAASYTDLNRLFTRLNDGVEALTEAYKDNLGRWHFTTA